jgi:uncharacterized lipoprotein YmbA
MKERETGSDGSNSDYENLPVGETYRVTTHSRGKKLIVVLVKLADNLNKILAVIEKGDGRRIRREHE